MTLDDPARVAAAGAGDVGKAREVGGAALAAPRCQVERPVEAEEARFRHRQSFLFSKFAGANSGAGAAARQKSTAPNIDLPAANANTARLACGSTRAHQTGRECMERRTIGEHKRIAEEHVLYEKDKATKIATITFKRLDKHNTATIGMRARASVSWCSRPTSTMT
jgi:hypothetical protein